MADLGFNTRDVAPEGDFSPIPAARYHVEIQDAKLEPTKDAQGKLVNVKFKVIGPGYAGRILFARFNIVNKSEIAQRIGRGQLSALAHACALDEMQDTDQLLGRELAVRVDIEEGPKAPQHGVKGFYALITQVVTLRPTAAANPQPAPAVEPKRRAPWNKAAPAPAPAEDQDDDIPY